MPHIRLELPLAIVLPALLLAIGCGGDAKEAPSNDGGTCPDQAVPDLPSPDAPPDGPAGVITCSPVSGEPIPLPAAKLFFEFNSTDGDTGIHGLFDSPGWSELCLTAPNGMPFLAVKPQGPLMTHTVGGIFFESREPKAGELSQAEILARFPAGNYKAVGKRYDGLSYMGTALLTHDLPAPVQIKEPSDGATVDPAKLVVSWDPVTKTVAGGPVKITGYEVIVTNADKDGADPHGMSDPVLSAHVIPSVNRLTIPAEFLEPGMDYELELLALEESGNQTITVSFFSTP